MTKTMTIGLVAIAFVAGSIMTGTMASAQKGGVGDNLIVEGHTEDGLIEAVSVEGSKNFAIGVQWHPEWQSTKDPVSTVIFSEFGKACYSYAGYDT